PVRHLQVPGSSGQCGSRQVCQTWRVGHGDIQASSIERDRGHHGGERVHGISLTYYYELSVAEGASIQGVFISRPYSRYASGSTLTQTKSRTMENAHECQ